ncbi:MAG: pentapeptide repeat-containing protein [Hyphomicrobium sp.]
MQGGYVARIIAAAMTVILAAFAGGIAARADQPLGPVSQKAEISAQQVTTILFRAGPGERPNLAGRFLAYLDLSDLNFKGASLARADLYGTDFTGANLSGADLSGSRLDRSVLIRANLAGANVSDATILRPTIYTDMSFDPADAPKFQGANLKRIQVQADLSGADFRGADLTSANFSPLEWRAGQGTLSTAYRNILKGCDFSGARMRRADMTKSILWFARFTGADLTDANFSGTDLSRADFSGADLTNVDMSGADLDGANFSGAIAFETVRGLDSAINLDRSRR